MSRWFESGRLDMVPHMKALGVRVVTVEDGMAVLRLPYSERLIGNPETGVLHGGALTAVLDNAAGVAVHSTMERIVSIATLDLRVDYMKPAAAGRDILARADCYKKTRNVAFVRGVAFHVSAEDPIASMTATFMVASNRTRQSAQQEPSSGDER